MCCKVTKLFGFSLANQIIFVTLQMLTHAEPTPTGCRSDFREGALHFENASLTLCFWPLEPRKFERASQRHRKSRCCGYGISRPAGVPRAKYALMHTF